jgi:hypothetical protein
MHLQWFISYGSPSANWRKYWHGRHTVIFTGYLPVSITIHRLRIPHYIKQFQCRSHLISLRVSRVVWNWTTSSLVTWNDIRFISNIIEVRPSGIELKYVDRHTQHICVNLLHLVQKCTIAHRKENCRHDIIGHNNRLLFKLYPIHLFVPSVVCRLVP